MAAASMRECLRMAAQVKSAVSVPI
jgi:hypothetical protein